MAVVVQAHKFVGSASGLAKYYEEATNDGIAEFQNYHGLERDGILFENVGGKAALRLPGLDLARGLTREQHAEIHVGRWDGEDLIKTTRGYHLLWETTPNGKQIKVKDPITGRLVGVPKMIPATTESGEPIIDELTGKPKMRQETESAFVNGYDLTFSADKSVAELLIARPELTPLVKANFLKAVNLAMEIAVQDNCELMVKTENRVKHKETGELMWFTALGMSARPTRESETRTLKTGEKVGPDPHFHAHCFLLATAYRSDGTWGKIDSGRLFKEKKLLRAFVSSTFNRLMEESGVPIEYQTPDRKGHIYSQFEGSNPNNRHHYSTNHERSFGLILDFERKYNREPTPTKVSQMLAETRHGKKKADKVADEVGNLDQLQKWAQHLAEEHERAALGFQVRNGREWTREEERAAGYLLSFPKRADLSRRPERERRTNLFERLESPEGVAVGITSVAVFGPEVILPAAFQASEGLGYTSTEVFDLAALYRDTELIVARPAHDPSAILYTTKSIRSAEHDIAEWFETLAAKPLEPVHEHIIISALRDEKHRLDQEQEVLARAACGTERVVHGAGAAGAGKSSPIRVAIRARRRAGQVDRVVVLASAGKRATEAAEALGADHGWTFDGLQKAYDNGWRPSKKLLVVIDEAAMVNTFEMAKAARLLGNKVSYLDIGDELQASPIGAAGFYAKELEARPAHELTQNYRQTNWRDARVFKMMREGDVEGALEDLAKRDRIFAVDEVQDVPAMVRERWAYYRDQGYAAKEIGIINTGANTTLDTVNRAIQREQVERGELSEYAVFTVAEQSTGRRWQLHSPGPNAEGAKHDEGERVIFNRGVYLDRDTEPVLNGQMGVITSLAPDDRNPNLARCRVRLDGDEQREVTIYMAPEEQKPPLAVAACMATGKWQGGEVKVDISLPGNQGIVSRNSLYSQGTRAVEVFEIVLSREDFGQYPVQGLAAASTELDEKTMASEYMALLDDELREDLADELDVDELAIVTPDAEAVERLQEVRRTLDGPSRGLSL